MGLVENDQGKMALLKEAYGFQKRNKVRDQFKTTGMSIWQVSLCEQRTADLFDVKETVLADSLELALTIKDDWILNRINAETVHGYDKSTSEDWEDTYEEYKFPYEGYEDNARVAEVMLREEYSVTVRLKEMRYVYRTEQVVLPVAPGGASLGVRATAVSFIAPPEELTYTTSMRAEHLHEEEELPAPELVKAGRTE